MTTRRSIAQIIVDRALQTAPNATATDVRIGLGYAGVVVEDDRLGLAAVPRNDMEPGCTVFSRAGTLAGEKAAVLLKFLAGGTTSMERTLGLATANAILHPDPPETEEDSIDLMRLTAEDRVAMVGFFGPLVKRIEATGAELFILELDPRRPGFKDERQRNEILESASVAIVTATSLLNGTIDGVLDRVCGARHVVLMGPSTPLDPLLFEETPVNHLAGSVGINNGKLLQVVSEGGGTPEMRPWLRYVNLLHRGKTADRENT